MPQYQVKIDRRVKKDLKGVSSDDVEKIKQSIISLAQNPRPDGCKKLKGKSKGYFRVRVGDYRIIYTVDDGVLLVVVIAVGHRKEVYKKL
ncbi:MAG: type II toxin-antitoxin system RelE/ParE family toxin [Cyanothece sp. SIO2G6]|nr:type II toxin-antitoxin system RelE/ParE family toxin [Cyanothece sp. SIO2G6]